MSGRCLVLANRPLHEVMDDIIAGLEARGWQIDVMSIATLSMPQSRFGRSIEAALTGGNALVRAAARLIRRVHREIAVSRVSSAWFTRIEAACLTGNYDVTLAYLDAAPVGLGALLTRVHPRTVIVGLVALTQELQHRHALTLLRLLSRATNRGSQHPDLLRAVDPRALKAVIFPTRSWRDAAVSRGVPSEVSRVITLGVEVPDRLPPRQPLPATARLLWVGRLSPEKGLHLFLAALPLVLAQRPVALTVIAAAGPDGYRRTIDALIASHELATHVTIGPAVSRDAMITSFANHDLLLFHSVFAEPVAQVMLHAAARGLPIVGPASANPHGVLRDDTAWCYSDRSPGSVANAILGALDSADARASRAGALRSEVHRHHNLTHTIGAFDEVLRSHAGRGNRQETLTCQTVHC